MNKRTCLIVSAVIIGVVVIGCVGLFVVGIIGSSSPTFQATSTARAAMAAATEAAKPTLTPEPSDTPTPTNEQLKALAKNVPYDSLARNTEKYVGELVYYKGQVVQVMEMGGLKVVLRVNVTEQPFGLWDDTIWVNYEGPRVLEDDIVHIWGEVVGRRTYTAVLGNEITIPEITAVILELEGAQPPDAAGTGRPPVAMLSTDTPVPTLYLGDAVEKYGYALTAVSVQDPATPGMFYDPEPGARLVAVEVVLSNLSGEPLSVNPLQATLIDGEGFTYQTELGAVDDQIATLDLSPAEKVRGMIAFQIPEGAEPASIRYSVESFGDRFLEADLTPPPERHVAIAESPSQPPAGALPKLGDVVEQFGYSLSAITVEDPATPGMFYEAREGYKLVAVEIIVGNVSSDALSVNPLYAYLVDSDGFVYTVELGGRDGQIATTDLNAGEKVRGWVAFTIPENATPASIKYEVGVFSGRYLRTGLSE